MSARVPLPATHSSIPSPSDGRPPAVADHPPPQQHSAVARAASMPERLQANAAIVVKELGPVMQSLEERVLEADALAFRHHPWMRYLLGLLAGAELNGLWARHVGGAGL